jgi:hypothetical protein
MTACFTRCSKRPLSDSIFNLKTDRCPERKMDAVDCMSLFFCHDGAGVRPIDSVRRDARFKLFPQVH